MVCRPTGDNIGAFSARKFYCASVHHQAGGVYILQTRDNVLRTKHDKAFEDKFPRMELICKKTASADRLGATYDKVTVTTAHSDHTNLVEPAPSIGKDLWTYTPVEPSQLKDSDVKQGRQ